MLRFLRGDQAGRRFFLRAAAAQVRKEKQRHDESGNERICMHGLSALHHTLLDKNASAAIGELRERSGRARA